MRGMEDTDSRQQILKLEFKVHNSNSKGLAYGSLLHAQLVHAHSTGRCSAEDPNSVLSKAISGAPRRLSALLDLTLKARTGKDADVNHGIKNYICKNCWLAKSKECFLTKINPAGKHLSSAPTLGQTAEAGNKDRYTERSRDKVLASPPIVIQELLILRSRNVRQRGYTEKCGTL